MTEQLNIGPQNQVKNLLRKISENTFFLSLVMYICLKNVKVPVFYDINIFYPLTNYLGFYSDEG